MDLPLQMEGDTLVTVSLKGPQVCMSVVMSVAMATDTAWSPGRTVHVRWIPRTLTRDPICKTLQHTQAALEIWGALEIIGNLYIYSGRWGWGWVGGEAL